MRSVRLAQVICVALAIFAAELTSAVPAAQAAPSTPVSTSFYVEPQTWASWAVANDPANAPYARVIAGVPQAKWVGDWMPTADVRAVVDAYVGAADQAGQLPVLTLYAIPHRDCGGYSAGGFRTARAYASWVDQVVAGIAGRPVWVVLEPDAVAGTSCLSRARRGERYRILRRAVQQLSASGSTTVYLDAGHSRWLSARSAAARLRLSGIGEAGGFSLNVSNFFSTAEEISYGEKLSALLGGAHYVVDTSRNGRGPAADAPLNWCNPTGRGLGVQPTTKTSGEHADAYLWIKHPGESDGGCERGDPKSGSWFAASAQDLVTHANFG